jgi:hypothetical protein
MIGEDRLSKLLHETDKYVNTVRNIYYDMIENGDNNSNYGWLNEEGITALLLNWDYI